jgi:D-alanyl-D-alanine carboxypeptidase/D-alanyl-D-alanine-endopeptidase (penicillin-binding protein 4)
MMQRPLNTRRVLLITTAAILLLIAPSFLFFGKQTRGYSQRAKTAEAKPATSSSPTDDTQRLSDLPADQELRRKIDDAIASSETRNARWGVFAVSVRDGRVLYARDAKLGFTPASNMKLYTTAVALDLLGPDFRWRTSVYANAAPDQAGAIDGDLTLYGRGAPDLELSATGQTVSSLNKLADEIYKAGVRHVRGNIVGDESYFRGEPLGDGWLWNDVQWYFGAEVSALTIGGNEINVVVTPSAKAHEPATIKVQPETDYVDVVNETATVERGKPATIGITRGLSDNTIRVWGDFPLGGRGFGARISVHKPALWAARLFRDQLKARGIVVDGEAVSRDAKSNSEPDRFNPAGAVELASLTSKSLAEVAYRTNKQSLNLEAELILRTLGREKGAMAADTDPRRTALRGDDKAGSAVVRRWLEQHGVPVEQLAFHDGSGLSRLNLVTPEATARLLVAMTKVSAATVFRDTLPIGGRDGTLSSRLNSISNRVFAKTGMLTYTEALSGYAVTSKGELIAFSIICNNESGSGDSTPTIDQIARLLAETE